MKETNTSSRNIVLIGMPGVGKSTVGVLLAKALRRSFLDTDLLIQLYANRSLQEIINTDGLQAFLDLEAQVIGELQVSGHVIATGGSVVYRESAMAHIRANGLLVYLDTPYSIIKRRLRSIATRGVAKHPTQTLRELYDERQPLYERYADLILDTYRLSPEETVTRLVILLDDRLFKEADEL